jgi:hypothetical protein
MGSLFWGLFFILLDFNVTFNTCVLGLLPDFVGFLLILRGLKELQQYSAEFVKIQPVVILMAVSKFITYLLDLTGVTAQNQTVMAVVGLVFLLFYLYIEYEIICGIRDMERVLEMDCNARPLLSLWKVIACFGILANLVYIFAPAVSILFLIVLVIADLVFLYTFYQAKKLYDQREP